MVNSNPSMKADSDYPADYIASFTGQHNQLMTITSADIAATDLLQSCDHLEKGFTSGPTNTIIPSGSHVSMCNSLYYPHKDRTSSSLMMTANFVSKSNPMNKYEDPQHQLHHFSSSPNPYHIQPGLHSGRVHGDLHEMNI